jgi:hypothetical protein
LLWLPVCQLQLLVLLQPQACLSLLLLAADYLKLALLLFLPLLLLEFSDCLL